MPIPPLFPKFQSTPSARRATVIMEPLRLVGHISIHALREEGDASNMQQMANQVDFNPRPPRGGRHKVLTVTTLKLYFNPRPPRGGRRSSGLCSLWGARYFNPRPPRGGRRLFIGTQIAASLFQSTPSARRATGFAKSIVLVHSISIHALREEGDPKSLQSLKSF